MAISQMKKLSLLIPSERLDGVLADLQSMQAVEVRTLPDLADWQEAFSDETVALPLISLIGDKEALKDDEALTYLTQQQERLEQTIIGLEGYLPKSSLWKSLRQPEVSMSFQELEDFGRNRQLNHLVELVTAKLHRLHELDESLKANQMESEKLVKWRDLAIIPRDLERFSFVSGVIGTISKTTDDASYHSLKNNPALTVQEIYADDLAYGVIIFQEAKESIALDTYHFTPFDYDKAILPKDYLANMEKESAKWQTERQQLLEELQTSQKDLFDLKVETDYVIGLYHRQLTKTKLASTKHLTALEGWIESSRLEELQACLTKAYGDSIWLETAEVESDDWDEVPIKLNNNPLVEPFELVTEMYALPKYYEKDPTPILAPFYFTFFGMMVADLGYGLLLTVATLLALKLFHLPKGTKRFLTFFSILGVAVSLWGLIYGSFFGYTLPLVLISTTTDVMTILLLSVAFGFITVVIGLFLGGLQKVKLKQYADAYHSGFAWVMILLGIFLLVLGYAFPSFGFLVTVGATVAILNAIGIVVVSIVQAKSLAGLGSGLFNLYNISSYVGDLVSFTRLMALGLSGASIGSAFNLIVGLFPGVAKFTIGAILFILLHAINIFLSLLSGYVHGARLMFVEFFGKFYEGGGKPFQPLKSSEKYVTVTTKSQSED